MTEPIRILLQTTAPFVADGWHIGRFSLLHDYLAGLGATGGKPRFDVVARNREAMARYGWSPYMHDPKLKGRLHRVRVPTLVLWGAADRITAPDYGRAYAAAIPKARFAAIERAGHFPHLEAPDEFARAVLAFAAE